jgi:HK97 family phage prohead protease
MTVTDTDIPTRIDRYDVVQFRDAEVASVDADEGTILLRAAPYNQEAEIAPELFESFAPGTFARAADAPHRVKLFMDHTNVGGHLIGHARTVEERPDGVWVRAKFSNTAAGQEARELAGDGTLDQCSVEFRALPAWYRVTKRRDGLHIVHARAHLQGVALVPHGAYGDGAFVASVRDADSDRRREAIIAHLRSLGG